MNRALLLIALWACAACSTNTESSNTTAAYDSLMAAVPDFSGVVLVAENGKPVYHKAFGYKDINTGEPIDTLTIFELASVSKQFTATAIMRLHDEHLLKYSDSIETFFPRFPYKGITIRHLLTHTSGLPDYQKVMDEHWDKTKQAGNPEIFEYLNTYHPPMLFTPGEKYEYSNTGYVVLGSIAQGVAGLDFTVYAKTMFFEPAGMTRTAIRTIAEKEKTPNFALGHIWVPEKSRFIRADSFPSSNYIFWLGARIGPGRVSSTASDLLKWDQFLYKNKLITDSTLQEAFQPTKLNNDSLSDYGYGWMLRNHPKLGKVVYHTGSNPGYNTILIRYVDKKKTIIVLCNNAHPRFEEIVTALEQILAHGE